MFLDITYAVRGFPILNDVTMEDAHFVGMDKIVKVISNGFDAPGTLLHRCSEEFLKHYKTSDLILSKGQGNYESLSEEEHRSIILGKERVVEAELLSSKAHAFTDSPGEFVCNLKEVLNLPLTSKRERSIYMATLNATLKYLHVIENTVHCEDEDPEKCGNEIASQLLKRWGKGEGRFHRYESSHC
jgi:hypothetical protein